MRSPRLSVSLASLANSGGERSHETPLPPDTAPRRRSGDDRATEGPTRAGKSTYRSLLQLGTHATGHATSVRSRSSGVSGGSRYVSRGGPAIR